MAHRSRLAGFCIDCKDESAEEGARFWSAALGSSVRQGDVNYVVLDPQGGLNVEVQSVDHPSRVHLDIEADDIPAEVERLERLGARKVAEIKTWVVMEAPTGHRFCVIRAQSPGFEEHSHLWE